MISRRSMLASTGAAALGATLPAVAAAQDARPLMIFVSAWDCPPCRQWLRQTWPAFRQSAEFAGLDWYKIDSPRIRWAYDDELWLRPKRADGKNVDRDLRAYRDMAKLRSGVPRWLLVKNDVLILDGRGDPPGTGQDWEEEVMPAIRAALGPSSTHSDD